MLPGIPVHIVQRGNNRQACFYEDKDRLFYLLHLARLTRAADCALHAYCLMTNHVHLLVTANGIDGCARLMKGIGQLHTQYVNRTYVRTGTLWEGRFRSCLVQSQEYLLACYRYIETNPVRARICSHPADYPWSSYRANAESFDDVLVTRHEEYSRLGTTDEERRATYSALFETALEVGRIREIRDATAGNFVLGNAHFRNTVSAVLGRRVERGAPGRPAGENVVCP
jgi:putative transposase